MNMPGLPELLIIFGALVLLFGARKLPALGQAVGESIKNFKKGVTDKDKQISANPEGTPEETPEGEKQKKNGDG